jgi:hypothetical protein
MFSPSIQKHRREKMGAEITCEKIKAENFLNLIKDINSQVQGAQNATIRINTKKALHRGCRGRKKSSFYPFRFFGWSTN